MKEVTTDGAPISKAKSSFFPTGHFCPLSLFGFMRELVLPDNDFGTILFTACWLPNKTRDHNEAALVGTNWGRLPDMRTTCLSRTTLSKSQSSRILGIISAKKHDAFV